MLRFTIHALTTPRCSQGWGITSEARSSVASHLMATTDHRNNSLSAGSSGRAPRSHGKHNVVGLQRVGEGNLIKARQLLNCGRGGRDGDFDLCVPLADHTVLIVVMMQRVVMRVTRLLVRGVRVSCPAVRMRLPTVMMRATGFLSDRRRVGVVMAAAKILHCMQSTVSQQGAQCVQAKQRYGDECAHHNEYNYDDASRSV